MQKLLGKGHRSRVAVRVLAGAFALVLAGCTKGQLEGVATSYLILESMQGAAGATPTQFGGSLPSDVLTFVKQTIDGVEVRVPTVFEDVGQVRFRLALKDPGTPDTPNIPSSTNFITVTRYRVTYVRADGRNTPGVDVPYPFDGGLTSTVTTAGSVATFSLVRLQSKLEAPLQALIGNGGAIAISTIAEITFYGTDQAGRAVSVTGRLFINFADWGDPE
jgi:hypothetical protein